jgi:hypothetical protein
MSSSGDADFLVRARAVLLTALDALADHRDALILIGAQAIYLHTGAAPVALAEATKDSDLAVDPRALRDAPLIDEAMRAAHFHRDVQNPQPGAWLSEDDIPVDLLIPEALAGGRGRRGVDIPPHPRTAARRVRGLEATLVDHSQMEVSALADDDDRRYTLNVAGPASLLVAKLHKIYERRDRPDRLVDKDAHDVYRLLVAIDTPTLAGRLSWLAVDDLAAEVTRAAMPMLQELFASGPDALGSAMAGRAEELVGDPAVVSAATAALAGDLLARVHWP